MKPFNSYTVVLCFATILIFASCQEDENPPSSVDKIDTVSTKFTLDPGSIGLVIDTREIARKGYAPSSADISFAGGLSSFSKKVDVNQSTNIATLILPVDNLTSDQIDQFGSEVNVTIKISDKSSKELASYSDKVNVDYSNKPLLVTTDLKTHLS